MNEVGAVLDRAAEQGGLITTAQARRIGVSRLQMSRLEQAGSLERIAQGVYRTAGSAPHEHEQLLAAWLALENKVFLTERSSAPGEGLVVGGVAAAKLHGIGDLYVDDVELIAARPRRTAREGIRIRVRDVDDQDVVLAHGLPALSVTATLADLAQQRVPLDHVANALRDGAERVDVARLDALLDPLAARNGFDDGAAFRIRLYELAGRDPESVAADAARSPLAPLIVLDYLKTIDLASLEAFRQAMPIDTSPLLAHLESLATPITAKWFEGLDTSRMLANITSGMMAPLSESLRGMQTGAVIEQVARMNADMAKQIGAASQSAIGAQIGAALGRHTATAADEDKYEDGGAA